MPSVQPSVSGDLLIGHLSVEQLGTPPCRVWNPSPSARHRTEPYDVPMTVRIGTRDTEESGAKFSPPPFAVIVETADDQVVVGVRADQGWHRWNLVEFQVGPAGVNVVIDLEGQTDPGPAAENVEVWCVRGRQDESKWQLLERGLGEMYPRSDVAAQSSPSWWRRPIYCGWGDQVGMAMALEGVGPERRALAYCLQGLYERWIARLEEADVPIGTVIIDAGWSPAGSWEPDEQRWPDLAGFIRRQHESGRKVLLWIATWLWDGIPDEWCVFADGVKLATDPTHPGYRDHVRSQVTKLLSPEGYDADGFKIDQLGFVPNRRRPYGGPRFGWCQTQPPARSPIQLAGASWGCELLHELQAHIYRTAKDAKPDSLITSSTVHPYFADTLDMVRLHDMGEVAPDIFETMGARADLARAAIPGVPIDTDDWVHTDFELWRTYTTNSPSIGVPCLFYAENFVLNWTGTPCTRTVEIADLRSIAAGWTDAAVGDNERTRGEWSSRTSC